MQEIKTDCLLDTRAVSQMLGVSYKSLANSRNTGVGLQIPFIKLGRLVRYKMSDVETYIDSHRFYHTGKEVSND